MLHYNFTRHIWPRCEVLRENGIKSYDMVEALKITDKEFCERYEIDRQLLD